MNDTTTSEIAESFEITVEHVERLAASIVRFDLARFEMTLQKLAAELRSHYAQELASASDTELSYQEGSKRAAAAWKRANETGARLAIVLEMIAA